MAFAKSSEKASVEPVDNLANGSNDHLSDNDEIAVGRDIEDDKKGDTRLQKVTNQEPKPQRLKNQDMFNNASKAVNNPRALCAMLFAVAIRFLADDMSRYLTASLYGR